MYFREVSLLRVLSGQLSLQGAGTISEGQCALLHGHLHAMTSSPVALWMIRDRNQSVVVLPKYISPNQYPALKVHRLYPCPVHSASSLPNRQGLKKGEESRNGDQQNQLDL
jgi:hypothetical protein